MTCFPRRAKRFLMKNTCGCVNMGVGHPSFSFQTLTQNEGRQMQFDAQHAAMIDVRTWRTPTAMPLSAKTIPRAVSSYPKLSWTFVVWLVVLGPTSSRSEALQARLGLDPCDQTNHRVKDSLHPSLP